MIRSDVGLVWPRHYVFIYKILARIEIYIFKLSMSLFATVTFKNPLLITRIFQKHSTVFTWDRFVPYMEV